MPLPKIKLKKANRRKCLVSLRFFLSVVTVNVLTENL